MAMATVNIEYEEYEQLKKKVQHQKELIDELRAMLDSIDKNAINIRIGNMAMQIAEDVLTKALRCNGINHPKVLSPRRKMFEWGWGENQPDDFWWMHPPYQIEVTPEAWIAGDVKTLWFEITKLQEPEEN